MLILQHQQGEPDMNELSYMIDPPSPYEPPEVLWAFLRRLRDLDPEDPGVQSVRLAVGSCLVLRD